MNFNCLVANNFEINKSFNFYKVFIGQNQNMVFSINFFKNIKFIQKKKVKTFMFICVCVCNHLCMNLAFYFINFNFNSINQKDIIHNNNKYIQLRR